jgi:hypothetical protein
VRTKLFKGIVVYGMAMSMAAPTTLLAAPARAGGGAPARSNPSPAPVYRAPAPVYRAPAPVYRAPAPVYRAPAPAPVYRAPAPVVSRPAPVQNRPAPVAAKPAQPARPVTNKPITAKPNPVTSKPAPAKPNPVVNKPAQPAKPKPVATKPAPGKTTEPVKGSGPGKPTGNNPVASKPTQPAKPKPVANNPIKPQPGKVAQKPASLDPARAPKPGTVKAPTQIAQHKGPSELDNKYSQKNFTSAKTNVTVIKNNVQVNNTIIKNNRTFNDRFSGGFRDRVGDRQGFYANYGWHNYYHGYWDRGFYGGYYYPFRPCYDISTYFWYPSLYWLYQDAAADALYIAWYGNAYYNSYPVTVFPFVRVYYPTETLRDMGIEVSAYPAEKQANFRSALTTLTQSLAQQIANSMNASVTLSSNDVVITHYQNLEDLGYSMEGYIDSTALNLHVGFKAFVDLVNPNQTLVFMPSGDQAAGDTDLTQLTLINDQITRLGGNPLIADVETDVASAQ